INALINSCFDAVDSHSITLSPSQSIVIKISKRPTLLPYIANARLSGEKRNTGASARHLNH
ncbi:hypothetical protein, partial [Vibrio alginolyticus]|uniref:hypothetical protein n=1 Tax=Vibrio alginolyticus TaxID=663 RepID=UPI003D7E9C2E